MTPQQLLIPRYEVIADYPDNDLKIGEVFEPNSDWPEYYINRYPRLFRPLHWSERREIADMPEYVKCNDKVFKLPDIINYFKSHPLGFEPATETDYLNYINANK